MFKGIIAFCCCGCGIVLCVFKTSAFLALAIALGVLCLIAGIYFIFGFLFSKYYPLFWGVFAICFGILTIVLCVFIDVIAFLLGGIVFCVLGIILIPLTRYSVRIILPLSGGCILIGAIIIFIPSLASFCCVLGGILLICYSHLVIIFLNE